MGTLKRKGHNSEPADSVTRSISATGTGLQLLGTLSKTTLTPTTDPDDNLVLVGDWGQVDYAGSAGFTGGLGHLVNRLDWLRHTGTGTISLAINEEAKTENTSTGTLTTAISHESQFSTNAGTITTAIGSQSRVTGNAGTIETFVSYRAEVAANTGTIGTLIGYEFSDVSAISGITTKYAWLNRDPGAPMVSAAPVIDQSLFQASPSATGFTITIGDRKQVALITPVAGYATGTINLPAKANVIDCQRLDLIITQAVAAVTWGANGAAFVLNGPASVFAGQTVSFIYIQAVDWWVCTSKQS